MGASLRVLLVEDSEDDADLVLRHLTRGGYDVTSARVETAEAMEAVLAERSWDIIISDYVLPRFSGPDALALVSDKGLDLPFIMVSGAVGEEMAAPILRERLCDHITKDNLARLVPTVERELREAEERRRRRQAEYLLRQREAFFRSLIENARDVILVLTSDGTIRYVSGSAARVFGERSEARVGRRMVDLIHPDDAPSMAAALTAIAEEPDTPRCLEVRCHCQGESPRVLEVVGSSFRDDSGTTRIVVNARDVTDRKEAEDELQQSFRQLRETFQQTVSALATTVEKRDQYTAGHQERVALLAHAIAQEMGLPEEEIEGTRVAAALHDIGKVCVPLDTLSKVGPLTEPERDLIKAHPRAAYDILRNITFPWPVPDIVLQHHERIDGSGYPSGLPGERILREAKVLAVADVVEAMVSHRPYRPARNLETALAEITDNKDVLYDVDAVNCCVHLFVDKGFELSPYAEDHSHSLSASREE